MLRGAPGASPVSRQAKKPAGFVQAIKFGAPLVVFCVCGYVALSLFVQEKYTRVDSHTKHQSVRAYELEEEHKRVMQSLQRDLATLEIKPIPPPPKPRD